MLRYICARNVYRCQEKGEGSWKVTRICSAGITIAAVMERIHYALRLIRRQADRAGSWQRHCAGVRCMVNTPKGSNHAMGVLFTYIFMYYFPSRPQQISPTMKQEGSKYVAAIYLWRWYYSRECGRMRVDLIKEASHEQRKR